MKNYREFFLSPNNFQIISNILISNYKINEDSVKNSLTAIMKKTLNENKDIKGNNKKKICNNLNKKVLDYAVKYYTQNQKSIGEFTNNVNYETILGPKVKKQGERSKNIFLENTTNQFNNKLQNLQDNRKKMNLEQKTQKNESFELMGRKLKRQPEIPQSFFISDKESSSNNINNNYNELQKERNYENTIRNKPKEKLNFKDPEEDKLNFKKMMQKKIAERAIMDVDFKKNQEKIESKIEKNEVEDIQGNLASFTVSNEGNNFNSPQLLGNTNKILNDNSKLINSDTIVKNSNNISLNITKPKKVRFEKIQKRDVDDNFLPYKLKMKEINKKIQLFEKSLKEIEGNIKIQKNNIFKKNNYLNEILEQEKKLDFLIKNKNLEIINKKNIYNKNNHKLINITYNSSSRDWFGRWMIDYNSNGQIKDIVLRETKDNIKYKYEINFSKDCYQWVKIPIYENNPNLPATEEQAFLGFQGLPNKLYKKNEPNGEIIDWEYIKYKKKIKKKNNKNINNLNPVLIILPRKDYFNLDVVHFNMNHLIVDFFNNKDEKYTFTFIKINKDDNYNYYKKLGNETIQNINKLILINIKNISFKKENLLIEKCLILEEDKKMLIMLFTNEFFRKGEFSKGIIIKIKNLKFLKNRNFNKSILLDLEKFLNKEKGHKIIKIKNSKIKKNLYNNTIIISSDSYIDVKTLKYRYKEYYNELKNKTLNCKGFVLNKNLQHSIIFESKINI